MANGHTKQLQTKAKKLLSTSAPFAHYEETDMARDKVCKPQPQCGSEWECYNQEIRHPHHHHHQMSQQFKVVGEGEEKG
jgi:hypothetical protein